MIYTKQFKQKLHESKVIRWYLNKKNIPCKNEMIIVVWWEYAGTMQGCYDLHWFVGVGDANSLGGYDFQSETESGTQTIGNRPYHNISSMVLFKKAYKLERTLKNKYPNHKIT